MTSKPFIPNASLKVEKMTEAAAHIYAAINALSQAQKCAKHWADYETLESYKTELKEIMSCDNGEAGFENLMARWADAVASKNNPVRKAQRLAKAYNK